MTANANINITDVSVRQGDAYEFDYPDGGERGITCDWVVVAHAAGDDNEYSHETQFPERGGRDAAEALADRVRARGIICREFWGARVMYGTQRWVSEGYEARQMQDERDGLS